MPWPVQPCTLSKPSVLMTALATMTAADGTIAIVGGKLLTITHGTIENGTVILSGGTIVSVGPAASIKVPNGATVIDAKGMTVYPGLFDPETNLGLVEVRSDAVGRDLAETTDEIEPEMHVYDAFHAESARIPVERLNGVSNAVVAPAEADSLPGQDSIIQLYGKDCDSMLIGRDVALPMNFEGEIRRRPTTAAHQSFPPRAWALPRNCARVFSMRKTTRRNESRFEAKPQGAAAGAQPQA